MHSRPPSAPKPAHRIRAPPIISARLLDGWRYLGGTRCFRSPTDECAAKAATVLKGVDQVLMIHVRQADFLYYGMSVGFSCYGRSVGPKDKDKVLLRWKLNDELHAVVFGDSPREFACYARRFNSCR